MFPIFLLIFFRSEDFIPTFNTFLSLGLGPARIQQLRTSRITTKKIHPEDGGKAGRNMLMTKIQKKNTVYLLVVDTRHVFYFV